MTTISGLPAHVVLVHFMVVVAPLTALLEILCGVWPAARRRLVWLVLAFAAATTAVTPLTTSAGQWLFDSFGSQSPTLQEHAELGKWMIYVSVALLVVAVAIAVLHLREGRADDSRIVLNVVVAVVAVLVGISSIVAVYRIGDSGARAVWGGVM